MKNLVAGIDIKSPPVLCILVGSLLVILSTFLSFASVKANFFGYTYSESVSLIGAGDGWVFLGTTAVILVLFFRAKGLPMFIVSIAQMAFAVFEVVNTKSEVADALGDDSYGYDLSSYVDVAYGPGFYLLLIGAAAVLVGTFLMFRSATGGAKSMSDFATWTCPNCRAVNRLDALFCTACGTAKPEAPAQPMMNASPYGGQTAALQTDAMAQGVVTGETATQIDPAAVAAQQAAQPAQAADWGAPASNTTEPQVASGSTEPQMASGSTEPQTAGSTENQAQATTCPQCGAPIEVGQKFCTSCGANLS